MTDNRKFVSAVLLALSLAAAFSCNKEKDFVNSPEDMTLSEKNLSCNFKPREWDIEFTTEKDWVVDSIFASPAIVDEEWLTVDLKEGHGSGKLHLTCTENNLSKTRKAIVRLSVDPLYPEYRSITLEQTGKPELSIGELKDITSESVTVSGKHRYEGKDEIVVKTGFQVQTNEQEAGEKIYAEVDEDKTFTAAIPVQSGNSYEIRSFAEDAEGNLFLSKESRKIAIEFSLGTPVLKGKIRSNSQIKDVMLQLPYFFGDGKTYTISATCDMEGIAIEPQEITLSTSGGLIELPLSGKATTEGTATFTFQGLPERFTETYQVSTEVLKGGKNLVLYWESFGEGYTYGSKAVGLTDGIEDNAPISNETVRFKRMGQPKAEYMKEGFCGIRLEKETEAFKNNAEIGFDWASAGPVLNLKKKENGKFHILHLDFSGASNLRLELAVRNPMSQQDLILSYSNDQGKTWTPIVWEKVGGEESKFVLIRSTSEITAADDMRLKVEMNSNDGLKKQVDDLRMIGDFE